jgi:hypothetical protein
MIRPRADFDNIGMSPPAEKLTQGDTNVPQLNVHAPLEENRLTQLSPSPRSGTWPQPPPQSSRRSRPTPNLIPCARNDFWLPKTTHYYKIVGECYVHGMMDGESFSVKKREGIEKEIFESKRWGASLEYPSQA